MIRLLSIIFYLFYLTNVAWSQVFQIYVDIASTSVTPDGSYQSAFHTIDNAFQANLDKANIEFNLFSNTNAYDFFDVFPSDYNISIIGMQ